jgi:hypothetical protein
MHASPSRIINHPGRLFRKERVEALDNWPQDACLDKHIVGGGQMSGMAMSAL